MLPANALSKFEILMSIKSHGRTNRKFRGDKSVTTASKGRICQHAVNTISDAGIKLQLPLHYLTPPFIEKQFTLKEKVNIELTCFSGRIHSICENAKHNHNVSGLKLSFLAFY